MSKRAAGEGAITRRKDGRWEARWIDSDGRRHSVYGKTQDAVRTSLREATRSRDRGVGTAAGRVTVAEHLDQWIAGLTVRPNTLRSYRSAVETHLKPRLGSIMLAALSVADVENAMRAMVGEGLSSYTVNRVRGTLRIALRSAERRGALDRNVAALARAQRQSKRQPRVLTETEVVKLFEVMEGDRHEAAIWIAAGNGLRRAEVLGLRWRDLDLDLGILHVRHTLQRVKDGEPVPRGWERVTGQWYLGEPKSAQGVRSLPMLPEVVAKVREHQARQHEEREAAVHWVEHDLVFPNEIGEPLDPTGFTRRVFQDALDRAGLPRVRLHDLRHGFVTALARAGVAPRVAQALAGHADISTTLGVYTHVRPEDLVIATAALRGTLLGHAESSSPLSSEPAAESQLSSALSSNRRNGEAQESENTDSKHVN
jgi:integrase